MDKFVRYAAAFTICSCMLAVTGILGGFVFLLWRELLK